MSYIDNALPHTTLDELLQKLSLNDKESKILLTLLKFGRQPASVIATKSGIPRSSVFFPLKNLIKKGFITKEIRVGVSYFVPLSVDELREKFEGNIQHAQKSLSDFNQLLPQLEIFKDGNGLRSSHVTYFEGVSGVCQQLDDILKTNVDSYYISAHNVHPKVREYLVKKYIPVRKKSEAKSYMIVNDSPLLQEYLKLSAGVYDEVYVVPPKEYLLSLTMGIYANKLSLMSFSEDDLTGVIIENQFFADHIKTVFMMLKSLFKKNMITKAEILESLNTASDS